MVKKCIQRNTELQSNAKNDSEKYFFKLINKSVFDKLKYLQQLSYKVK